MPRFVIRHPDLEEWHISVNDKEKADGYGQVEIFFKPWGIRPDIYYDKMDFLGIEESDERFDFYIGLSAHEDIVKKINEKINPS